MDNTCVGTGLTQQMETINLNQEDISDIIPDILSRLSDKAVSHKIIRDTIEEAISDRKSNGKDSTILENIWADIKSHYTGKYYIL
jgi:hypothetical protein